MYDCIYSDVLWGAWCIVNSFFCAVIAQLNVFLQPAFLLRATIAAAPLYPSSATHRVLSQTLSALFGPNQVFLNAPRLLVLL